MKIIGIIPARLSSSRLPRKPMADILGMPMIGHVFLRSKLSQILDEVYVATCDQEIVDYIESIGGKAIMTANQGDEPMITPEMITASVEPILNDDTIKITNLMAKMNTKEEHEDPAEVKVVVDLNNFAMYFSREPIPSRKKGVEEVPMLKQVCIIPFKRDFLLSYNEMKQTPLEIIESVDMNRLLENGIKIKMVMRHEETYSVDTPDDLRNVNAKMENDPLLSKYM